jgi:fucose permease
MAAAIGMTGAAAEIIGGCVFPPIAGKAADLYGLQAPFLMMGGLALIGVCLILFLVETAPARRALASLPVPAPTGP